eukprot:154707_1
MIESISCVSTLNDILSHWCASIPSIIFCPENEKRVTQLLIGTNKYNKCLCATREIHIVTPRVVQFSLIEIDCASTQSALIEAANAIVEALLDGTRREMDAMGIALH